MKRKSVVPRDTAVGPSTRMARDAVREVGSSFQMDPLSC
jgi:hypothetical protein